MIDPISVGARISFCRQKEGLTQKDLAQRLCVCPQAVSKWECGLAFPDISCLDELAKHLRCSIDELLTGKQTKK